MVVKSTTITITVTAPAPPAKPTLRVVSVTISATRYSVTQGGSVTIYGQATLDKAVPSGYEAFVDLTLKYTDPDGRTGTAGTKSAKVATGSRASTMPSWTITLNKAGKWKFWIEAPDEAYVQPVGGR